MTGSLVPAHHRIAEKISRLARQRGGFHHSLLIHGPVGAGQREAATRVGQSIFCETGEGPFGACGACRNCRRIRQGIHPDWIWLEPDRTKGLPNISIELLRELLDRLVLEPYEDGKVVGCIFEADKMKPEGANSILKLVEEPPAHALFILVTENRQRILPTIQSRCLPIPLGSPSTEDLAAVLEIECGLDQGQSFQAALWSANEGLAPGVAISESSIQMRQEVRDLLNLAVKEGEHAFFPVVKALKYDREMMVRMIQILRDFLRDGLFVLEGGNEPLTYRSDQETMRTWSTRLSADRYAALIDRSFAYEEAVWGYANPSHTLGAFLSEVAETAG